jgi:hypothetical protein
MPSLGIEWRFIRLQQWHGPARFGQDEQRFPEWQGI